jgi:hypothetical protein
MRDQTSPAASERPPTDPGGRPTRDRWDRKPGTLRILICDQAERDAIASRLMRYHDQNGQDGADIIDS